MRRRTRGGFTICEAAPAQGLSISAGFAAGMPRRSSVVEGVGRRLGRGAAFGRKTRPAGAGIAAWLSSLRAAIDARGESSWKPAIAELGGAPARDWRTESGQPAPPDGSGIRGPDRLAAGLRLSIALLGLAGLWCPGFGQVLPPPLRDSASKIRWSSYVQARYSAIENDKDLFGLRRFKLMVGGNLSPRIQWYTQGLFKAGNNSPTDGRAYFQEAWLRFAFRKEAQLAAGQFKPAFGRERFTPDFEILTMDRSLVTDALTPDGPYIDSFYRDRGIQLDGELERGFRYAIGAFDGRGANHRFRGIGPMVVGQLLNRPLRPRAVLGRPLTIQLGLAAAWRRGGDLPFRPCCPGSSGNDLEHFRGADRRWGVEFSGDWGDFSVRAEVMKAHLHFAERAAGADFAASGWYVQAAKFLSRRVQAVAKLEAFDPNERVVNAQDTRQATFGLNYYLRRDRAKLMTSYVARGERVQPRANNLFQLQLQMFLH
jgi:hypothetical protein